MAHLALDAAPLRRTLASLPRVPLPREHGSWVMLLLPLAVGGVLWRPPLLEALALGGAGLAAYVMQNALAQALRPRVPEGARLWGAIAGAGAAALGLPLLLRHPALALLALPAALLLGFHLRLQRAPASARLDRSLAGQLLAAAVLALGAPAMALLAPGAPGLPAAGAWLALVLGFAGGVLYIHMRLEGVKWRKRLDPARRWRLGRLCLGYHAALAALALAAPFVVGPSGALAIVAVSPGAARALLGWRSLGPEVPSFKRLGMLEAGLMLWYAAWLMPLL